MGEGLQYLQSIYRDKARYCIIVVSQAYAATAWTRYELKQAQARAFRDDREYILPLILDDTALPGLNPTDFHIDLRVVDSQAVCDLVVQKLRGRDTATPEPNQKSSVERNQRKKTSFGKSFLAGVHSIARTRVHRLVLMWVQLILASFLFGAFTSNSLSFFLTTSVLLVFPLSIAVSRLVDRNILIGQLVGGVVTGALIGTLAFVVTGWEVRGAILHGAFYGASLTAYFSRMNEYTTLFVGVLTTCLFIGTLWMLQCANHQLICIEIITDDIDRPLSLAVYPIILGILLGPLIRPVTHFIESLVDKIVQLFQD